MQSVKTVNSSHSRSIPLWLKLTYTLFMCVLVPFYWNAYGPTNFLYFCDVALFLTLAALWLENPLLAGMPAVGIILPQTVWVVDFLTGIFGFHPIGLTEYMFRESIPLFARSLSLFHGWLPFFLLWLVYRLGYDPRSMVRWTLLAWGLLLVCYFFMPAPPAPADNPNLPVNINYVYGLSDTSPQQWLGPNSYFVMALVLMPLLLFFPTHLVFQKLMPTVGRNNRRET